MLIQKRQKNQKQRKVTDQEIFRLVYPGSIVWEYFIRGRKKFSELQKINRWLNQKRRSPKANGKWKIE
jgi:hypothetical protein